MVLWRFEISGAISVILCIVDDIIPGKLQPEKNFTWMARHFRNRIWLVIGYRKFIGNQSRWRDEALRKYGLPLSSNDFYWKDCGKNLTILTFWGSENASLRSVFDLTRLTVIAQRNIILFARQNNFFKIDLFRFIIAHFSLSIYLRFSMVSVQCRGGSGPSGNWKARSTCFSSLNRISRIPLPYGLGFGLKCRGKGGPGTLPWNRYVNINTKGCNVVFRQPRSQKSVAW